MSRRRSGKSKSAHSKPRAFDPREGKLKRWEKLSDIPLDEEDQFHVSRDKILLEDEDLGDDDEGDDDEVFALKGIPDDEEEDEDEDEVDAVEEPDHIRTPPKKSAKSKQKKGKTSPSSSEAESESEEEGWGNKKSAYYSSNAAQLESDDEEANELEEQEAKRLQAKARDGMAEGDFGLEDAIEGAVESDDLIVEAPAVVAQPLPKDKQSLLRHLEKTSPETLALARDWDDIAHSLVKTQQKLASLETEEPDPLSLGMIHMYYQALLTYSTVLAFYLHLAASEKYAQHPELLRAHPVLPRLLTLKQSVTTLEDLNFGLSDGEDEDDEDEDDLDVEQLWSVDQLKGLDEDELDQLIKEATQAVPDVNDSKAESKGEAKKIKAKRPKSDSTEQPPPKKKRKTESESKVIVPVFDLVEPDFTIKSSTSRRSYESAVTDVYGEATALQSADAADKRARQKSLRFHTSRIESTSARRQSARNNALGGDDDIPYRERRKQKEERLVREAAKTRGAGGDDLDDAEPEPQSTLKKRAREGEDEDKEDTGDDGYYELVQRKSKADKEKKKAEYDAAKLAARPNVDDGADGPRALTRAILKNKGLTPHRGKSVRNPRVKKRQKYEKAKKKLASQKAIYKGGLRETGKYEGEKSGISRVIKSVRL
ncbi:Sas10 C-terminal domain-containing protein [Sparassis latifolia]